MEPGAVDTQPSNVPRSIPGRIAALAVMACALVSMIVATGLFAFQTLGSPAPLCADPVVSGNLAFTAGGISLVVLSTLLLYSSIAACGSCLCPRATEIALGLSVSVYGDGDERSQPNGASRRQTESPRPEDSAAAPAVGAHAVRVDGSVYAAVPAAAEDDAEAGDADWDGNGARTARGVPADADGAPGNAGSGSGAAPAGRPEEPRAEDPGAQAAGWARDAADPLDGIPVAPVVARPNEAQTAYTIQRFLVAHSCVGLVFTVFFVVHGFSTVYRYADPVQMEKLDACNGLVRTVTEIVLWLEMGSFLLVAFFFCCCVPCVICLLFAIAAATGGDTNSIFGSFSEPPGRAPTTASWGEADAAGVVGESQRPEMTEREQVAASTSLRSRRFDAFGSTVAIDEHTASLTRRLAAGGPVVPPRAGGGDVNPGPQSLPRLAPRPLIPPPI